MLNQHRLYSTGASSYPLNFLIAKLVWLSFFAQSVLAAPSSESAQRIETPQQLRDLKSSPQRTQVLQVNSKPEPPKPAAKLDITAEQTSKTMEVQTPLEPQTRPPVATSFVPLYEAGGVGLSRVDAQRPWGSTLSCQANLFLPLGNLSNAVQGFFQLGTPQTNLSALTLQGAIGGMWLNSDQTLSASGHVGIFFQQAEGSQFKFWPGARLVYKDCELSGGIQLPLHAMKPYICGGYAQILMPTLILENSYIKLRWHRESSKASKRGDAFSSHWLQIGGVFHLWKDQLLLDVMYHRCLTEPPADYKLNRGRIKVGLRYRYKQSTARKVKLYNEPLEYPVSLLIQNDLESGTGGGSTEDPTDPSEGGEDPTDPGQGEDPTDPGQGEELTPPKVTMAIPGIPQGDNSITIAPDIWIRGCGVECTAQIASSQNLSLVEWSIEPSEVGYFSSAQGGTSIFYRVLPDACKIKARYPNVRETVIDFPAISSNRFFALSVGKDTWAESAPILSKTYLPSAEILMEAFSVFGNLKAYAPLDLASDNAPAIFTYIHLEQPGCARLTQSSPWFEESVLSEAEQSDLKGLWAFLPNEIQLSAEPVRNIDDSAEDDNTIRRAMVRWELVVLDSLGVPIPWMLWNVSSDKLFAVLLVGKQHYASACLASTINAEMQLGKGLPRGFGVKFTLPPLATDPWGFFQHPASSLEGIFMVSAYPPISWFPGFASLESLVEVTSTLSTSGIEFSYWVRHPDITENSETAYAVSVSADGVVDENSLGLISVSEQKAYCLYSPALHFDSLTQEQQSNLARLIPVAKFIPDDLNYEAETETDLNGDNYAIRLQFSRFPIVYGMPIAEAINTLPKAWIADLPCLVNFFDPINSEGLLGSQRITFGNMSVPWYVFVGGLGLCRSEVSCYNSEGPARAPFDSKQRDAAVLNLLWSLTSSDSDDLTMLEYVLLVNALGLADNGFTRNDLLSITCEFKDSAGQTLVYTLPALEEGKLLYVDSAEGFDVNRLLSTYQLSDLASADDALEAVNFLGWPHRTPAFLNLDKQLGFWVIPVSATSLAEAQVLALVSNTYEAFEVTVRAPGSDEMAYPLTRRLVQGGAYTRPKEKYFAPLVMPKMLSTKINQLRAQLKNGAKDSLNRAARGAALKLKRTLA